MSVAIIAGAGRKSKTNLLRLFDELAAAFRAADIDFALAARNADNLTAAGAAEIAVLLICQTAEKAQESCVFTAAGLNVA